ncbi:MAG TPA: tRNA (adenosine(37)-N6)-threonylcarbamoyltransferase complex dimerization subunit type 1 TsaB, partial [bacterium]|nr:tRNA (adenosine(37)-N6)-threonylcarbamoyltransferase complex dimerization subunit type 1 TsaB [bacterium]
MKILSIDTTTMLGSVSLSEGADLVVQEQQGVPGTHSERLLLTIDHLLRLARWGIGDVEAIAVAIGPGSFTGLRIGLATAKGIAMASGLRIAGVSSLASLAMNGAFFCGTVVPMIDARRGEIYSSAYSCDGRGELISEMDECVSPPDELISRLDKIEGPILMVGDGA